MVIEQFVAWHHAEQSKSLVGSLDINRSARIRELFKLADYDRVGKINPQILVSGTGMPVRLQERIAIMAPDAAGGVGPAAWDAAFAVEDINGFSLSALSSKEYHEAVDEMASWVRRQFEPQHPTRGYNVIRASTEHGCDMCAISLIRGLLSRQQHSSQLQTRDWAKPRRCPSCRWIGSNRWRVLSGHPLSGSSRFLPNRIPSMLTCQSLLLPSPRQNIHTMMATTTHHHNHYSHHDDDDDDDHHHRHAQLASTPSPDPLPSIGQPHIHAHAHTHAHAHSRVRHTRTHMCAYTCTFLQVAALFSQLDPSGSGKIGIQGLSQHSVALGPHAATPFNLIEQMDADGDGDVTREEMLTYFRYASVRRQGSNMSSAPLSNARSVFGRPC